jgi:hypothetical protein
MEFRSAFLDTLKLLLTQRYIVSDGDLKSLSDIIFQFDLEEATEDGLVTSLLFFLEDNNLSFPLSYNFMRTLWEKQNLTSNFDSILTNLISFGLVSLRKLSGGTFFNSLNITKNEMDSVGQNYYIVVYGTSAFNEFKKAVENSKLLKNKIANIGMVKVIEGVAVKDLDSKFQTFIKTVTLLTRNSLQTDIKLESFEYDSLKNEIEFNFNVVIPNAPKLKQSDINRVLKKHMKNNMFLGFESYPDSLESYENTKEIVFINLKIDLRTLSSDLKDIANKLINALDELLDLAQEE